MHSYAQPHTHTHTCTLRHCHVCAMWGELSGRAGGLWWLWPSTTEGKYGMQRKPSLKTAVHASFLLLMALPRHPIGRLASNSYSSPSTKCGLFLIVVRFFFSFFFSSPHWNAFQFLITGRFRRPKSDSKLHKQTWYVQSHADSSGLCLVLMLRKTE